MGRSTRLFEIIQLLRSAEGPLTAETLADALEVTKRTIYRDVAALQAMRVPVEGEAGVGYVMRPGFDLPPLMLTDEEVEAITVGLALPRRTKDSGLQSAAESAGRKIGAVLPGNRTQDLKAWPLYAAGWNDMVEPSVDLSFLRKAIRDEAKLQLNYTDAEGARTHRTILPLALVYYIEVIVLAAWCELRGNFRHFRVDRFDTCDLTGERFRGRGEPLRRKWRALHSLP